MHQGAIRNILITQPYLVMIRIEDDRHTAVDFGEQGIGINGDNRAGKDIVPGLPVLPLVP